MALEQVNLNELRIFAAVYRTRSMTLAARELHLTQSGVSQHILALEKSLGLTLFDRIHRALHPTNEGVELYRVCKQSLKELEAAVAKLRGESETLRECIRLGAPLEFGNNVLMPLMEDFCKKHPEASYDFQFGYSTDFLPKLLEGHIDFAIVDEFASNSAVELKKIYVERLDLCVHQSLASRLNRKDLLDSVLKIPSIDYDSSSPLIQRWLKHHFGKRSYPNHLRAVAANSQSVATLVLAEAGAGILPHHLYLKLKSEGRPIVAVRGPEKALTNTMSLATLRGKSRGKGAATLVKWIESKLA